MKTLLVCSLALYLLVAAPASAMAQSSDVVLHARTAQIAGNWVVLDDSTAAGGKRLENPDKGVAKLDVANSTPKDYFEMQFTASAGVGYRLWMRGKASSNSWTNDSAFVQFSGSVAANGAAKRRIGTSDAIVYSLEDCSGCGVSGWGWNDDVYGPETGELIYFATSGTQTIRVQSREDGLAIDQIVLSPASYLTSAPGFPKNDTSVLQAVSDIIAPLPTVGATVVMHAANGVARGRWSVVADATAASGKRMSNPDANGAKPGNASANPADYFELQFPASAGVGYRLWIRGKAQDNYWGNDSAFVQFSDSVNLLGQAAYRIGTTASTIYTIEDCNGCGVAGWGWNDNFYGVLPGELIYFAASGTHTVRIQAREDGLSIDQIVLSPVTYALIAPGKLQNDGTILPSTVEPPAGAQPPMDSIIEPPVVVAPRPQPEPELPPTGNLKPVFEADPDGFRIAARDGANNAPAAMFFSASAFGPEATDTLTYTWNFGDGTPEVTFTQTNEPSRQNVIHTYTKAGTFTASVTVTDQAGNKTTRTGTVTVGAAVANDIRVFQLNASKGRTTDTRTVLSRTWLQARWIAQSNADVAELQEVMGSNHAKKYKEELEKLMPGTTWSYFFRTDAGKDSTTAQGIAILTRLPILSTASKGYQPCTTVEIVNRAAIAVTVNVNGRNIVVVDTHLSSYNGSQEDACRRRQAEELVAWSTSLGPNRIVTGDMNAGSSDSAIVYMMQSHDDMWLTAKSASRATAYPDNNVASGRTRSTRIDYVFTAKGSALEVTNIQIPDTRDYSNDTPVASETKTNWAAHNVAPRISDHEALIATFRIK